MNQHQEVVTEQLAKTFHAPVWQELGAKGRRWHIDGSYWYSDNYVNQLAYAIRYSLSGQKQMHSIAKTHAISHEIRTGRSVTHREYREIFDHVENELGGFFERRNSEQELDFELSRLMALYQNSLGGDFDAADALWSFLEDDDRLKLTLHFWELRLAGKLDAMVWGNVLKNTWQCGKGGCLLLHAKLAGSVVKAMFKQAALESLMGAEFGTTSELQVFNSLPEQFVVWRGVASSNKHLRNGYSWTLDRNQACWFAYRNTFGRKGTPALVQATVRRDAVMALFGYEQEVVINPDLGALSDVLVTELSCDNDDGDLISKYAALRGSDQLSEVVF